MLIVAALAPLATAGFLLVTGNERALEHEVKARLDQTAEHAALAVTADVEGRARGLPALAALLPWATLGPAEIDGALRLLVTQARAQGARLYDASGKLVSGAPVQNELAEQAAVRARKEGSSAIVFSAPYASAPDEVVVDCALAVTGGGVVAVTLPLKDERARLTEVRGAEPVTLWIGDDRGRVVASTDERRLREVPREDRVLVDAALTGDDGHARRIVDGARRQVAGFAPIGGLGWHLFVEADAQTAFAAARALRRLTLGGAAVRCPARARRCVPARPPVGRTHRAAGDGGARAGKRSVVGAHSAAGARRRRRRRAGRAGPHLQSDGRRARGQPRRDCHLEPRARIARRRAHPRWLKEAQSQLVQAQKLAALGQLGAGAAHEINTPLGAGIGHVPLWRASMSDTHPDADSLRHIEAGARRASDVVQSLLRFSVQHQSPVRGQVNANKLVKETLMLTESLLATEKVALELELDKSEPRMRADGGQIAQVLLNLVANARTAMAPQGGTLRIATRADGGEVALSVSDSGRGIAPEIRERIFEPFFTTKDDWSNVGLGLSVSYRIVSEHDGRITVDSEVGKGSTFTIHVPSGLSSKTGAA